MIIESLCYIHAAFVGVNLSGISLSTGMKVIHYIAAFILCVRS